MGQAKIRKSGVGQCIYCGLKEPLSNEHVIPYGLSGDLILYSSSCTNCAKITSQLEQKLLRGHWWPYRQILGLKSRRDSNPIPNLKVTIKRLDDSLVDAELEMKLQTIAMVFHLSPPTILSGNIDNKYPFAKNVSTKMLGAQPTFVNLDGQIYQLSPNEKLEIPINFDAGVLSQFLAKIAHSYAIHERGLDAFEEFFLPGFILGIPDGAMTYVGGCNSPFVNTYLPGNGLHAMMTRINNGYLTVYIQLFRDGSDPPPPIYEVVVGKLRK